MREVAVFGAGGGIGAALVAALAAREDVARVFAVSRQGLAGAGKVAAVVCDPFDAAALAGVAAAMSPDLVIVATGALTLAGGIGPEKSLRAVSAEALLESYRVNAVLPALIVQAMLSRMPRDRRAVLAVLSARVGSIGDNKLGGWHAYRASKAALNQLLRTIAVEARRTHPRAVIAALHPGTVATGLTAPFVGGREVMTPAQSAARLLEVVGGLEPADSGGFFAWDGTAIPW